MIRIVVALYLIAVIGMVVAIWSDRRWYKKHPGANAGFCKIDDEVSLQEGR